MQQSAGERLAAFAARFEERRLARQAAREAEAGGGREAGGSRGGRSGAVAGKESGKSAKHGKQPPVMASGRAAAEADDGLARRLRTRRGQPDAPAAGGAATAAKGKRGAAAAAGALVAPGASQPVPARGRGHLGPLGALLGVLLSRAVLGTACFVAGVAYADASPQDRGQRQRALAKAHRAVTRAASRARDAAGPRLRDLAAALAPVAGEVRATGAKVLPLMAHLWRKAAPTMQLLARLAAQHLHALRFNLQRRATHEIEGPPAGEKRAHETEGADVIMEEPPGTPRLAAKLVKPAAAAASPVAVAASAAPRLGEALAMCSSAAEARGSVTKRAAEVVAPPVPPPPVVAASSAAKPPLPFASPQRVAPPASPVAAMPPAARAPLADAPPASPARLVPVNAGGESPQEARQRELDAARAYRVAMVEEAGKRLRAAEEVTAAWSAKTAAASDEVDAVAARNNGTYSNGSAASNGTVPVPSGLAPVRTSPQAKTPGSVAARASELDAVAQQRADAQAAVLAARARLAEVVALTKRSTPAAAPTTPVASDPAAMAKLVAASQRSTGE